MKINKYSSLRFSLPIGPNLYVNFNFNHPGKVAAKSLSKKVRRELRKEDRRNQSQQIRQKKRDEALAKKRSLGGSLPAPLLVVIIPLNGDLDTISTLSLITGADQDAIIAKSPSGVTHIR